MKFSVLFMPVIFSAAAQLLVKGAASYEIKTSNWLIFIGLSLVSYVVAFVLYSFTVRNFPITVASPINTIAVMIIVFLLAALLFGEVISAQIAGINSSDNFSSRSSFERTRHTGRPGGARRAGFPAGQAFRGKVTRENTRNTWFGGCATRHCASTVSQSAR